MDFRPEVSQHPQPNVLTLLRMKLHATNIPARHYRRISPPIFSLAYHNLLITRLTVKRVYEITERCILDALKQGMLMLLMNSIPPNLRHDELVSKPAHTSFQQPKTRRRSKLI